MSKINLKLKNQQLNKGHSKINLEEIVMNKIKSGQAKMKPKWYFAAGSLLMIMGLVSLTLSAIFLFNLTVFLVRKHGPGYGRLEIMLNTFPYWIPILAVLGAVLGILLLKKYDFSYNKNFPLILMVFLSSIIIAALSIDYLGLNDVWSRRGPMKRFYQHFENQKHHFFERRNNIQYNRTETIFPQIRF